RTPARPRSRRRGPATPARESAGRSTTGACAVSAGEGAWRSLWTCVSHDAKPFDCCILRAPVHLLRLDATTGSGFSQRQGGGAMTTSRAPARRSCLLHRNLREDPPVAVGGHGVWLVDAQGREVLDGSGGAAVSCLGHQHPRVLAALASQAKALAYAHTSF